MRISLNKRIQGFKINRHRHRLFPQKKPYERNHCQYAEIVNKEEKENVTDISTIRKKAEEGRTLYLRETREAVEENMPPFALTQKDENKYKKELDAVKLAISMMYNKLAASMDAWLGKGITLSDYTKERSEMMKNLRTQVLEEESLFAQSMEDYRQSMIGSNLAKAGESKTWAEMLRFQRSVQIDLDAMDKQPDEVGAGTSEVLKIKRDGKVFYFKEEDATFVGDPEDMVLEMGKFVPGLTRQEAADFIKAIGDELDQYDEDSFYEHFFDLFAKPELYSKVKKNSTIPLEGFLANVPKKRRKTIEDCFRLVFKTYNQQVISSYSAKIDPGSNLSRRNVATSRLASLLGIGDIVAESRTAVIKKNGQLIRLSGCFRGVPADKIRRLLKLAFIKTLELYGPEVPVYLETEYPPSVKLIKYGVKNCPVEKVLIGIRPVKKEMTERQ